MVNARRTFSGSHFTYRNRSVGDLEQPFSSYRSQRRIRKIQQIAVYGTNIAVFLTYPTEKTPSEKSDFARIKNR
jgi:hypothetical protein